jgi:uncharacterized protein (TIGR00369 family)
MTEAIMLPPRSAFGIGLGIRYTTVGPGHVVAELPFAAGILNAGGNVHGGAVATLIDTSASCAIPSAYKGLKSWVTVDLSVSFLTSAHSSLRATARTVHAGTDVAAVEVEVRGHDLAEPLVATGLVTFRVVCESA